MTPIPNVTLQFLPPAEALRHTVAQSSLSSRAHRSVCAHFPIKSNK